MRIIAGKYKGIKLYAPINKKTRPLKDMVRESIFNFLIHSNKISFELTRSNILDLYSGTGSFGLECLSRESNKVFFVEKEKEAINILKKNIEKLKVEKKTEIFHNFVLDVIKKRRENFLSNIMFDLIFFDPPFKDVNTNDLIKLIISNNLLKRNGIIILHKHKNSKEEFTKSIKIIEKRVYGVSKIIFGQPAQTLP
tara:strand:+ start:172 stop:759 length:588 start_codon:yes stop_codon:yes gene_type:complete